MSSGLSSRSGLARKSAPARRVGWKGSHRCSRVASELWIERSLGFGAQKRARYRGWLAFQLESHRWMYGEPDMQPAECPARRMRSMSYLLRVFGFLSRGYVGKKWPPNQGPLSIDQLQWDIHRRRIFLQKADRSKGGSDLEPPYRNGSL